MSYIGFLESERQRLRDEYKRVVTPLAEQIHDVNTQIMNLKRESGQLFYVEYMRHHAEYTEECETLEDAKGFARELSDNRNGYVMRIHGPGGELGEFEWDD